MAGLTNAESKATLDARFPTSGGTDYLAYSDDGSSEFAGLARTAIGATGWEAATTADPSVKANANALTSAAATSGGTITHVAVFSASTAGTQRTDWQAVDTSKAVGVGDQVTVAVGAFQITLS
ncbi:phage tail fiber protein [Isoptericola aurantiacus]|uniref:phage tail fiber protein n=1 Tax=Isoptericola aurantiacus TaxID=3377839 RepID=UPI00383ACF81